MTATDLPFPLSGSTLITGPSNVGKTRLTVRALDAWIESNGPEGVVLFEFGPKFEHEDRILGRYLERFTTLSNDIWQGVLDARAPRAEGSSVDESVRLAAVNAERAAALLADAPDSPVAVFVNDATIPFQHESGSPSELLAYCNQAEVAVLNAFESDELGEGDPVSLMEQAVVNTMRQSCNRSIRLNEAYPDRE